MGDCSEVLSEILDEGAEAVAADTGNRLELVVRFVRLADVLDDVVKVAVEVVTLSVMAKVDCGGTKVISWDEEYLDNEAGQLDGALHLVLCFN